MKDGYITVKPEWEINKEIDKQIKLATKEHIGAVVADRLQLDSIVEKMNEGIRDYFRWGKEIQDSTNSVLAAMLDKRLAEVVANITDEELKNAIMNRLITRMQ